MKGGTRGQILVLFVLALVVLIGLAAIGVDVAYWYSVRHELQRSADAGALAGASRFKETGYWVADPNDPPSDENMRIAWDRARLFAMRDNVVTSPLDNSEVFVRFPANMRIYVGTQRTVPLFFSRLFLGPTKTIRAYAVAEAFAVTRNVTCVVPWGIPAPWNDNNNNGIYDSGDEFEYPNPDDNNGWAVYQAAHCGITGNTMWDQENHVISGTRSDRDNWLCDGSLQILKLTPGSTDNATTTRVPGNFYGMDFFDLIQSCPGMEPTHGADFYSYLINHSCECNFRVDLTTNPTLDTETGNMVGPTVSPVAPDKYYAPPTGEYYVIEDGKEKYLPTDWRDEFSLMNGDKTGRWVDDPTGNTGGHPQSDDYVWTPPGQTPPSDKQPWWKSPRVVKLPIYSPNADYPPGGGYTPEKPGKTSFKPLGFVGFWIQDIQYFNSTNGTIVGRFVTVPGEGTSSEPGPAGTQVLNIRLVE